MRARPCAMLRYRSVVLGGGSTMFPGIQSRVSGTQSCRVGLTSSADETHALLSVGRWKLSSRDLRPMVAHRASMHRWSVHMPLGLEARSLALWPSRRRCARSGGIRERQILRCALGQGSTPARAKNTIDRSLTYPLARSMPCQMWISKEDYDENGPLIVHRKVCFPATQT